MEILSTVKGKPSTGIRIMGWVTFIWAVCNLALFIGTGSKGIVFLWFFVIILAIWYVVFFRMKVDYDYLYFPETGQFQVARITNKNRRKLILSTQLDEMYLLSPENSPAMERFRQDTSFHYIDYSSKPKNKTCYLLFCNGKKQKICLRFEPSEKMLTAIKERNNKLGQQDKVVIG